MTSFTEKLGKAELDFFNSVCAKPFSQQAVSFLNAYWNEVGDQAEFIFTVAHQTIMYADMHTNNIHYFHEYEEGNDLDFNIGLYFYERLCKFLDQKENKEWIKEQWKPSQPELLTAIVRKKELREKVDVNFDGRISFLEYLLYQYREFANPADFIKRSEKKGNDEPEEIRLARLALEEVNKRIREYEKRKQQLTEESKGTGVKALRSKNMLAQLEAGPIAEHLRKALILAEAAVRKAVKMYGAGGSASKKDGEEGSSAPQLGATWWMNRDLQEKKKRYGR